MNMEAASRYLVREASANDVDAVVSLINRAFAVERFFKSGDRISSETFHQMMLEGRFLLLIENSHIVGCVFVKVTGQHGYLGTLSVEPARQRSGLGARMMRESEAYLRAAGCNVMDIRIVDVRPELREIYTKFGFVETGTESAEVIRTATRPVHFITMSKEL